MKNTKSLRGVEKEIIEKINNSLINLGIMFRIFSRQKCKRSLETKIKSNTKYQNKERKIQDILGIRIVLYFPDDIKIVHKIISKLYTENNKDASIDELTGEIFKPIRYNLIYDLPPDTILDGYNDLKEYIDLTFELQIRTVLSEGWHEVEHDLRYKFKGDWTKFPEEDRKLNGVYASLEIGEWTMLQILHSIAYKHYKDKNWEAMFRQHFRVRLINYELSSEIKNFLDSNNEFAKSLFKLERTNLIEKMHEKNYSEPLNINNLIYFANTVFLKNSKVRELTPKEFWEDYAESN